MKALVSGMIVGVGSYQSKNSGKTVHTADLYDGKSIVRISNVPECVGDLPDGEIMNVTNVPVNVGANDNGMYAIYAGNEQFAY